MPRTGTGFPLPIIARPGLPVAPLLLSIPVAMALTWATVAVPARTFRDRLQPAPFQELGTALCAAAAVASLGVVVRWSLRAWLVPFMLRRHPVNIRARMVLFRVRGVVRDGGPGRSRPADPRREVSSPCWLARMGEIGPGNLLGGRVPDLQCPVRGRRMTDRRFSSSGISQDKWGQNSKSTLLNRPAPKYPCPFGEGKRSHGFEGPLRVVARGGLFRPSDPPGFSCLANAAIPSVVKAGSVPKR